MLKTFSEFIVEYKKLVDMKKYWLNYNPISIHEDQNKRYFINETEKRIQTLIKENPTYAKEYYLI
jgi:hypothetical protein